MELSTRAALVGMGAFTVIPVMSLFQPSQLENAYGVVDPSDMVLTLLQHRGVFQFLLGAALIWAAFRADVRVPVAAAAITSKGVALGLVLSRPEALELSTPGILAFDAICIVLLTAIAVIEGVGRGYARAKSPSPGG